MNLKRIALYWLLLSFALWSCTNQQKEKSNHTSKGFELKVTTPNEVKEIYLAKIAYSKLIIIDTSKVKQGIHIFKGMVSQPEQVAILSNNKHTVSHPFILENTSFEIQFNGNHLSDEVITNSPLNTEYADFKKGSKDILQKMTPLYYQLQEKRLQDNSKNLQEISSKIKVIKNRFFDYSMGFIHKNPNSYNSLFVLKDLLKMTFIDTSFFLKETKKLSKKIQQHPNIKEIKKIEK